MLSKQVKDKKRNSLRKQKKELYCVEINTNLKDKL